MRLAMIVALILLAGCDDAPPAGDAAAAPGGADPALQSAAENECAQMTNYQPDKLAGMSSEMQALVKREYTLCVAKVGGD